MFTEADTTDLPSRVQETLAACPKSVLFPPFPYPTFLISSRFRIVVVGNVGIFVVSSYTSLKFI